LAPVFYFSGSGHFSFFSSDGSGEGCGGGVGVISSDGSVSCQGGADFDGGGGFGVFAVVGLIQGGGGATRMLLSVLLVSRVLFFATVWTVV
jgi:hypothetical protein